MFQQVKVHKQTMMLTPKRRNQTEEKGIDIDQIVDLLCSPSSKYYDNEIHNELMKKYYSLDGAKKYYKNLLN